MVDGFELLRILEFLLIWLFKGSFLCYAFALFFGGMIGLSLDMLKGLLNLCVSGVVADCLQS